MFGRNLKEFLKVLRGLGPPSYREKIDDLNKKARLPLACSPDGFDQFLQARKISIMTYSQQWTAGNIANAGGFDDNCPWLTLSEPAIPIKIIGGYKTVFGCTPRHHRRNPGAACQRNRTDRNWSEQ